MNEVGHGWCREELTADSGIEWLYYCLLPLLLLLLCTVGVPTLYGNVHQKGEQQ